MIVGSADGSGRWYKLHGQWLVQYTWSMVGTTNRISGWYNIYGQWLIQLTWLPIGWYNPHDEVKNG